ncbi:cyclic GMP-AMP synthase-like receptor 2 [Clytia hemisphaerica]|uniref:cyclic GMP-AMP synthase-like receptor 2 n=1 Tax=Clytia hemisphaerica TaxID=252671 RepID=UPI0034D7AAEA
MAQRLKSIRLYLYWIIGISSIFTQHSFRDVTLLSEKEQFGWYVLYVVLSIIFLAAFHYFVFYENITIKNKAIPKERTESLMKVLTVIDKDIPSSNELRSTTSEINEMVKPMLETISSALNISLSTLLSGSTAERFNVPLIREKFLWMIKNHLNQDALSTDHDLMVYDDRTRSSFDFNQQESDFFIDTMEDDIDEGFAKIYSKSHNSKVLASEYKQLIYDAIMNMQLKDLPFYSHSKLGAFWIRELFRARRYAPSVYKFAVTINGPAINIDMKNLEGFYLADITFAIQCQEWPGSSDWLIRDREWPNMEDVHRIQALGFHLVPKSQSNNDRKGKTWRFSFSKAEVELSKLINPIARKCFIALKIIAKDFLKPQCKQLKSYHLKTIFYRVVEQTEQDQWTIGKIEIAFHFLLDEVIRAVINKDCRHFWLQQINLFENFTGKDINKLTTVLMKVKEKPTNYLRKHEFRYREPIASSRIV